MSSIQVAEGTRTARKTHECVWCEGTIEVGEAYSYWTVVDQFEHTAHTMKTHHACFFAAEKSMEEEGLDCEDSFCPGPHEKGQTCDEAGCNVPHCHPDCTENYLRARREGRGA